MLFASYDPTVYPNPHFMKWQEQPPWHVFCTPLQPGGASPVTRVERFLQRTIRMGYLPPALPYPHLSSKRLCLCPRSCNYQNYQPLTFFWQLPNGLQALSSHFSSQKTNLDKENPSNYRPISNLSFLSKLTERIVLARLNDYLSSNSLFNPHQSGFTKHHSTETLLVSLYNKLVSAVSHQQVSCLCLLDISAAFDTIDHNILLQRLSSWFGVSGTALLWFHSYLFS